MTTPHAPVPTDPHADYQALLARIFERWPDLQPYAGADGSDRLRSARRPTWLVLGRDGDAVRQAERERGAWMTTYLPMSDDARRLNPDLAGPIEYRVKPERLRLAGGDGFDSQLERDWCDELKARGLEVQWHGLTFHLPGGVDYTPDAVAWGLYGLPKIYEVKGNMRQKNARDSRTRFKIAAGLYPWAEWVWVTRERSGRWIEKSL